MAALTTRSTNDVASVLFTPHQRRTGMGSGFGEPSSVGGQQGAGFSSSVDTPSPLIGGSYMSRNSPRTGGTGRMRMGDGPSPSPRSREGSMRKTLSGVENGGMMALPPPPIRSLDPFTSPSDGANMDVFMMSADPLTPSGSLIPSASPSNERSGVKTPAAGPPTSSLGADLLASTVDTNNAADCWVTVFGFSEGQKSSVLQEFQRCGEVVELVHPGGGAESGNWLHLCYSSKYAASIALRKNATQLWPGLMIGVSAVNSNTLKNILESRGEQQGGAGGVIRAEKPRTQAPVVRPYHLNANLPNGGIPQPSRTTWHKVAEYVFGM